MAAAAALIERIGDVDDCAHSAAARKRAQTLVKQEDPMFYGSLLMQHKGWLSSRWIERCAVVADGWWKDGAFVRCNTAWYRSLWASARVLVATAWRRLGKLL